MAAAKPKKKRLLYLRASFSEYSGSPPAPTLEVYLKEAYAGLPLVENRIVDYADKSWFGNWYEQRQDCFFFQFSAAVPGESATTLPTSSLQAPKVDLKQEKPPQGSDFADGDIICCVAGDDLFVCCSHMRDTAIQFYLNALFAEAGSPDRAKDLRIDRPARFDVAKMIQQGGVRSIRLNATLERAEFQRLEDVQGKGFFRKMIGYLVANDKTMVESARDSGTRFTLSMNVPKKKWEASSNQWITDLATEALDEDIPYRIETQDGKVIRPGEITISKPESFAPFGKTVFRDEAVRKLLEFKNEFFSTNKAP